jgi:hypothetical protein
MSHVNLPLAVKIVPRLANNPGSATAKDYCHICRMVYNEKLNVESKFDVVADIVPGNENFRIKIRVVCMWKVPAFLNPTESVSLEMVLIDEKV